MCNKRRQTRGGTRFLYNIRMLFYVICTAELEACSKHLEWGLVWNQGYGQNLNLGTGTEPWPEQEEKKGMVQSVAHDQQLKLTMRMAECLRWTLGNV